MNECERALVCLAGFLFDPHLSLQSRGGTAKSSSRGRRGVCEHPPCPPSSCHITIRLWSRTANYVCVWQPRCQGAANKTAGKRRIRGGGWGRWSPSPHVRVRHGEDDHLVVIFAWFHCKIILFASECVWCVLRPSAGPRLAHLFIDLFNSSDKTNWILVT